MNFRSLLVLGIVIANNYAFAAPVPRIMQVFIGGYSGPSYEIMYDGRALKYYKAGDMHALVEVKPEIVAISDEKWGAFLRSLDDIQIWEWKRRYVDSSVADGTTWSCAIVYDTQKDRTLVSYGSNGHPPKFDEFLKAVSALVDGREFE